MKSTKSRSLVIPALAILGLLPLASAGTPTPANTTTEPTGEASPYTLFTGADINVVHLGAVCRVRGVEGDSFVINFNGGNLKVPMGANPEQLKITPTQQLSDRVASVTKYKFERVYTPANDPHRKFIQGMNGMAASVESATALAAIRDKTPKQTEMRDMKGNVIGYAPDPGYAEIAGVAQKAAMSTAGDTGTSGYFAQKLADEQALELFDALDVTFEVSATKPLAKPYLVIIAKYHEKEDAKSTRRWLFAKALDPIGATPTSVSVREQGFPLGFVVDSLQVHLYQNGREVATSLSEHRAGLSVEEAHEYLIIEYVSANKNATKDPRIALARLPDDWRNHRQDASFRQVRFVKVDKAGRASEVFEDKACTTKVRDSYYEDALKNMLFLPALENGQAVDGIATITPADVAI
jgi:hypothetical protein